jgi:GT2 family glycosyltransferase
MDLSVIIVTWNSENHIEACLASIAREKSTLTMEVIVVDNGSGDNTMEIIQRHFPWVRLLKNKGNLGFTRACNAGLRAAQGKHLLLLNPDTVVMPGSLQGMMDYLEETPRAGAVGPQLLYSHGGIQPSCRQFPTYRLMLWEFLGLRWLFPHSHLFGAWRMGYFDHNHLRSVDQPMGACLFLRGSALHQIGLLDERFGMFFSDVDLCRRLKLEDWDIVFYPTARVVHDAGSHVRRARGRMIVTSHQDCYRYFRKYRRSASDHLSCWLLGCGLILALPPRLLLSAIRFSR